MDLLERLESSAEAARRRVGARYAWSRMARLGFRKPAFGTEAYHQYVAKGWITSEEVAADAALKELRAERTGQRQGSREQGLSFARLGGVASVRITAVPSRWLREGPVPSDQYAPAMATTAARDDRLTPQAKALLQVLHARCGKEGHTRTTKGTLGNILRRCERSIQRYLCELSRFGYIVTDIRRNGRGLYTGLVIRMTSLAHPFWRDVERCGRWMMGALSPEALPFPWSDTTHIRLKPDKTRMSPKNPIHTQIMRLSPRE